jgi:hypothetical protein
VAWVPIQLAEHHQRGGCESQADATREEREQRNLAVRNDRSRKETKKERIGKLATETKIKTEGKIKTKTKQTNK